MGDIRILKISIPERIGIDDYEARLLLAIELYREGRLTLKQAAELAGLCVEDFMRELSRRKISIINLDEEELEEELRIAEEPAEETRN
ncbi:MAG: UPF0175 family protein [Caldisphaeraceae archaeon]|nr:UPF0175 family protein [Caldisphaeraceae archaeon]MEB3691599.1 UPF0175 family protein [Caldisphaeraceae archaeon]MEB3797432.1 UPF0175 family protein [Caldisphaeraceae archaeon]